MLGFRNPVYWRLLVHYSGRPAGCQGAEETYFDYFESKGVNSLEVHGDAKLFCFVRLGLNGLAVFFRERIDISYTLRYT